MSPRKKKAAERVDSLTINFTGRMVVVAELEGYGPMEIGIDDMDAALDVMRTILKHTDQSLEVNAYSAGRSRTLRRLLEPVT